MKSTHAQTKAMILDEFLAVTKLREIPRNGVRFEDWGADSFDLVTIRCELEQKLGRGIPDRVWLSFRGVEDIVQFYLREASPVEESPASTRAEADLVLKINMPQMAVGGLSESWLFKELGDLHWQGICRGLRTESDRIADACGSRLYATFVRFRWEGSAGLKSFQENERVRIENRLSRFGKGIFLSDASIEGSDKTIRASLMSAFTSRQGDNRSLLKGEPVIPEDCPITVEESVPRFSEEYRQLRKRLVDGVDLGGRHVAISNVVLAEVPYDLNPYQDINGVNLLYFAAYPMIAEICERKFVHENRERLGVKSDWALETSAVARDIFYFGNCDIDDTLLFRLHSFWAGEDGRTTAGASLSRKSDGQLLCMVFNVKERQV